MTNVLGLHHVSTIAGDPQRNLDFFAGLLGLRLVKRTVNFDDPQTYHLYYGDEVGTPGCIMTFFPWPGAKPGRQGPGEVAVTSFSVLPSALGFWLERFVRHGVPHESLVWRGSGADAERVLAFRDRDGAMYELVGHPAAEARPAWTQAAGVPAEHAIHGFHSVTLWVEQGEATERVLVDLLGFRAAVGAGDDAALRRRRGWPEPHRGRALRSAASCAARRARASCTTSRSRLPTTSPSSRCASASSAPGSIRRKSGTGTTFARSTFVSRAACCSSSRRASPVSRWTSRPGCSASG